MAFSPKEAVFEVVDPELLALEAPPRVERHAMLVLMAFAVASALALASMVWLDVAYVFSSRRPIALGEATAAAEILPTNRFARIAGTPMMSASVGFTRLFGAKRYVVFPLAGQRNVYVQVPVEGDPAAAYAAREFEGRLVKVSQLGGRFSAVRSYMERRMELPVSGESYLLLAEETPVDSGWAIGLVLLAFLFVGIDVALILRWFRPIPA